MALRCLVFSSNEEMVQPVRQVLADLGIEAEYCKSGVDAVERVTTQGFQIVITDWQDQPEAAFLLKTARDLKAALRPLTLAMVSEDARPQALQAGANSVLLKPIRAEQVRETMSTACELLRSKFKQAAPVAPRTMPETAAMAAAASSASSAPVAPISSSAPSVPISAPASVTQAPEKIRAGELLQSAGPAPGAQFDTESEARESMEQASGAEVDALTELEPMAAAVEAVPEQKPEPSEPLTGWASLQARLTTSAPIAAEGRAPKNELLSYGDPSYGAVAAAPAMEEKKAPAGNATQSENNETQQEGETEALFAYMAGEPKESPKPAVAAGPKRGKVFVVSALALASVVLVAVPRTRQTLAIFSLNGLHAGRRWLNPPPAALPQAVAQHDSFGQSGDEYKLPVPPNIPDATTDPTQIQVVPVVDPTVKPGKGSQASGGQAQAITSGDAPTDQNQAVSDQSPQAEPAAGQSKDPAIAGSATALANPAAVASATAVVATPTAPPSWQPTAPPPATTTVHSPPTHAPSAGENAGIPSSLKSQIASSTPESSGNKPEEAAMSSIEPVKLPEAALRELLAEQPVDPEYPTAAKNGQRGNVVLQVLVGRDGTVQDAKFLQGSLVFARGAIDAVKHWHFKPYSMNGRAVSVESVITLNFKPAS